MSESGMQKRSEVDKTLKFIEYYRDRPCLWDMSKKEYLNKTKRNDAINEIAKDNQMTPSEVKNKIKSLRSYFSKEHNKVVKRKSGSGADEIYVSHWFAYKPLAFILDSITPRKTKDTILESTELQECNVVNSCIYSDVLEDDIEPLPAPPEYANDVDDVELPTNSKKRKKKTPDDDAAVKLLNIAANELSKKDDLDLFGEMVAGQLRKLSPLKQITTRRAISTILYDAELEQLSAAASEPYEIYEVEMVDE